MQHSDPEIAVRSAKLLEWHKGEKIKEFVAKHQPMPWLDMIPKTYSNRDEIYRLWINEARAEFTLANKPHSYHVGRDLNGAYTFKCWPEYRLAAELWFKHALWQEEMSFEEAESLLLLMRANEEPWLTQYKKNAGQPGTAP